jgi:predicted nucleic acid-binding protein
VSRIGALDLLLATLPDVEAAAPLMSQAPRLAILHECAVYDCTYVALALREGCPLITADVALARRLAPSLGTVATLPQAVALLSTTRPEREAERGS